MQFFGGNLIAKLNQLTLRLTFFIFLTDKRSYDYLHTNGLIGCNKQLTSD